MRKGHAGADITKHGPSALILEGSKALHSLKFWCSFDQSPWNFDQWELKMYRIKLLN